MMSKSTKPLDIFSPENTHLPPQIIRMFAELTPTPHVVEGLILYQNVYFEPEVHKDRDQLREMIRTINPNNAKFNEAKWGELLETYRHEFASALQIQMSQSVCDMISELSRAISQANLEIQTPKDMLDCLKIIKLLQEMTQPDGKRAPAHIDISVLGSIPTPPLEPATAEVVESKQLQPLPAAEPGKNGQTPTV